MGGHGNYGGAICIMCGISFIFLAITVVFISLSCVRFIPIMNNSKKAEPLIGTRENLIHYNYTQEYDEECEDNLISFLNEGIYETFNLKIEQIHKYSKGLIYILFIIIGLEVITIIIFLCIFCVKSDKMEKILFIFGLLYILGLVLNIIFFILLSIYYFKGKYKELENFAYCGFFDSNNFMETYDYIFEIKKNFKKGFIFDIIFISLIFVLIIIGVILKIICK